MHQCLKALATAVMAALLLTACAETAQTLRLTPKAPPTGPVIGDGQDVALEVVDRRENEQLGRIENRKKPPAPLTTEQDLAYVVKLAAADALSGYGFDADLWSDDAEPRLLIEIERIEHTVDATVPYDIRTEVVLSARAWNDGSRYSAEASASLSDITGTVPNAEENAAYIEQALAQALDRLFDEKMARFLAGRI